MRAKGASLKATEQPILTVANQVLGTTGAFSVWAAAGLYGRRLERMGGLRSRDGDHS
jgi:hypothetical protein